MIKLKFLVSGFCFLGAMSGFVMNLGIAQPAHASEFEWHSKPREPLNWETRFPPAIIKLLNQRNRPTVAEFETAMNEAYGINGWPQENPFKGAPNISSEDAAILIATAERAFPGATYLGLGRDVALLADTLDAFYSSIGQPGRVKRLDASGPSFPHYNDGTDETFEKDRELLAGFLKTNGMQMDLEKMKHPFVIFDVTSWRRSSQSRQLVRAAYQSFQRQGTDLHQVYDRVNFLGIPMGGSAHSISPDLDVEAHKAKERDKITSEGPLEPLYLPSLASRFTYTDGWHEMFRSFTMDDEGNVVTSPGDNRPYNHEAILGELYSVVKVVHNPQFLELVKTAARELGYEFPVERTETLHFLPKDQIPARVLFKPSEPIYRSDEFGGWLGLIRNRLSQQSTSSKRDMRIYFGTAKTRITASATPAITAGDLFEDLVGMIRRGTATKQNMRRLVGIIRGRNYDGKSLLQNETLLGSLASSVSTSSTARQYLLDCLKPAEKSLFAVAETERQRNDDTCEGLWDY